MDVDRYTTNGAVPTLDNSLLYSAPLPVSSSLHIRACVFDALGRSGNPSTAMYTFHASDSATLAFTSGLPILVLRENDTREAYWSERQALIELEQKWRDTVAANEPEADTFRRQYDGRLQAFLSKYCEEWMLSAGQDKECVENSNWDAAHTRHASRILRFYRNDLYQKILERLPYAEVTPPSINWTERARFVRGALDERN
mgnify:CR=1 FL=1